MRCVRVFTGDDGKSCIESGALEFEERLVASTGRTMMSSILKGAQGTEIRKVGPAYVSEFHCAPSRQLVVMIAGTTEVEVSDGSVERIGPGEAVLFEDLTGEGHISRSAYGMERVFAVLPLANENPRESLRGFLES